MPPLDLVLRVGTPGATAGVEPFDVFDAVGRAERNHLLRLLPRDWSFSRKRVLDFGCGSGRTLRHLLEEAREGEIWGCDIHRRSIEWLEEELSPPLRVLANDETPPLPFESGSFDLVYTLSVFSHLTGGWSAWLAELHRVLAADGILVATFNGRGVWQFGVAGNGGVPFEEDRIGMHVEYFGASFADSWGPAVYLSEWWLRDHWGRAFDILSFEPEGFPTHDVEQANRAGQGVVVLRKRPVPIAAEDLEAPSGDARELPAALASRDLVYRELAFTTRALTGEIELLRTERLGLQANDEQLRAEAARLGAELAATQAQLEQARLEPAETQAQLAQAQLERAWPGVARRVVRRARLRRRR